MSIKQLLSFTLACVAFILTTLYCVAKSNQNIVDTTVLSEWQAGKTVTADVVKAFGGIDKCFAAESIPDEVWQRMQGKSYYDADDEAQMRDNNSSCFCYRAIAGGTKLSKHALGLAIDINSLYNPYYKDRADGTRLIQPATAAQYCDRTKTFPYKIDHNDLCYRLFTQAGFEWGGDWTSCKDFQHFELIEQTE